MFWLTDIFCSTACGHALFQNDELEIALNQHQEEQTQQPYIRYARWQKQGFKGKRKSNATLGWEHAVVRKDGLAQLLEYTQKEASPKRFGCRKGELLPEIKEKMREHWTRFWWANPVPSWR
jgi:hypothetical protein